MPGARDYYEKQVQYFAWVFLSSAVILLNSLVMEAEL